MKAFTFSKNNRKLINKFDKAIVYIFYQKTIKTNKFEKNTPYAFLTKTTTISM